MPIVVSERLSLIPNMVSQGNKIKVCDVYIHIYIYISELVPQWLERLTGHQRVAGSISVWGSEILFLR